MAVRLVPQPDGASANQRTGKLGRLWFRTGVDGGLHRSSGRHLYIGDCWGCPGRPSLTRPHCFGEALKKHFALPGEDPVIYRSAEIRACLPDQPIYRTTFDVMVSQQEEGLTVVHLTGELDISCAQHFTEALDRACASSEARVVIDASQLLFIDAFSIRALVRAHDRLLREGRRGLVVHGATRPVRRVLEITQLSGLLADPCPEHPSRWRKPPLL